MILNSHVLVTQSIETPLETTLISIRRNKVSIKTSPDRLDDHHK